MAEVPIYHPTIPVQNQGTPDVSISPMGPASAPTNVAEAAAGIGKEVEHIGSQLEQHMVMQEKLEAQQKDYSTNEAFKTELQNRLMDPEKGILAKNKGVNALNGVHEYDSMINGVPSAPGKPGTPPLREQFLKDASPYDRARLGRMFAATESAYRGKLMNTALAQKESADQQISEARMDSEKNAAALVTPTMVNDPASGKLIPHIQLAEKSARDAVMNDVHLQLKGVPKEKLAQIAQDHVDEVANIAIEANVGKDWKSGKAIYDASGASPTAKIGLLKTINGARTDQYTDGLTQTIIADKNLRQPNGQIDEVKAHEYMRSQIAAQEQSGSPLPPGHADAIFGKVQSQIEAENKGIQTHGQALKDGAISGIYKAAQDQNANRAAVRDQFVKNGKFLNGADREAADDFLDKAFKKDPTTIDDAWSSAPKSQQDAVKQLMNSKEVSAKFPYSADKKAYEDVLKQKIMNGGDRSADAVGRVHQDMFEKQPTGAVGFFGGKKTDLTYAFDEKMQNNPTVKSIGLFAAEKLAQRLGGPDVFKQDSPEANGIEGAIKAGWKPEQIGPDHLKLAMAYVKAGKPVPPPPAVANK